MSARDGGKSAHEHLTLERDIEEAHSLRQRPGQGGQQNRRDAEHDLVEEIHCEECIRHRSRRQVAPRMARKRMTIDSRTIVSTRGISTERSMAKPPV